MPPVYSEGDDPELVVERFPNSSAGIPVPGVHQELSLYQTSLEIPSQSTWARFQSQCDWELVRWAKMHAPTSLAVGDLLAIPRLVDSLELSYHNPQELNNIVDAKLPGCAPFMCQDLLISDETLHFYYRDIIQCLRVLYGDPKFARDIIFTPEHQYTQAPACRVYSDMHTGDWWWASQQTSLESHWPGVTVIPVILSSDKTQLTLFHAKAAYPAQILMGYIPTTKLTGLTNKAGQRHAFANIFHSCMQTILAPITRAGETGIVMMSGDGTWRRCHPVFAIFIGDYPEQILVMCTYSGQCPKSTDETYSLVDEDVHVFHAACQGAGLKPVFHPFWESLPLVNIFVSITPDILHQMLHGVMKHLIMWLTRSGLFGAGQINAWCWSLPPNHHVRTFSNGISTMSRVSGQEHKDMCQVLLSLIVDLPLPSGQVTSRVVRSLPSQTTNTVACLDLSLARFHDNKAVFVDLGVCEHFNIPNTLIALFGTTDNYNTEQTERLHIDFTKDAYRATNHKDEYPQMTTWLEHCEKVLKHAAFIKWQQQQPEADQQSHQHDPKPVSFNDLSGKHGTVNFQDTLADFIAQTNHPEASAAALRMLAADTLIPFCSVPVFYRIKYTSKICMDAQYHHDLTLLLSAATIKKIAQVRVIFQLPERSIPDLFPSLTMVLPTHLTYVEWFSPIPATPDANSSLYRVSRSTCNGQHDTSIIPVASIFSSVHLFPRFGQQMHEWNTFSVLELCHSFYINPFSDQDMYLIFS
ncbi:hypothetical protein EDB84DRAFT_1590615 [Lactarius hengduanensis]|nr:hypothetical protein EDB84DRAFT_1590615 [Lactarius hengduanensis]